MTFANLNTNLALDVPGVDLGKVAFVIVFLVAAFIQWLIKLWKQKQEMSERLRTPPPPPEEIAARREAWKQQTRSEAPPAEMPPPLLRPEPARNPFEELLEQFRRVVEPSTLPPPPVAQPPPLPPAARPVLSPRPPVSRPLPSSAPPEPAVAAPVAAVLRRGKHPLLSHLAAMGGLRQAVILREILGPPKALQAEEPRAI